MNPAGIFAFNDWVFKRTVILLPPFNRLRGEKVKKALVLLCGFALVGSFVLPEIYREIMRNDLDYAAILLMMLYGFMMVMTEFARSPQISRVVNIIIYIIFASLYLLILMAYRTSNDVPAIFSLFALVTAVFIFNLIRTTTAIEKNRFQPSENARDLED
ncbi:hypothetical protein BZG73_14410 [Salinivibrio siamensis]|uniref:Uncharacterized protein n=1 Tax=Salinivibrio siamensis TaxID=414286 RepID=A0ABX3K5I7_9GAMM|nr:hypothetical protein BZG73_14410 [Salinivibrio siamensis]